MHKFLPKVYYFIDKFDLKELQTIKNNIGIIYRNYNENVDEKTINSIRKYCKNNNQKFYLSNHLKIAIKLKLDGLYLPSFNNKLNTKNYNFPDKFNIIGSAHNEQDIKIKEKQGCKLVFLAPVFKVNKKSHFLNIINFNKLSQNKKIRLIALGGINENNIKMINLLNCYGFAGISWIKKNGLNKFRPFLNCLNRTN